MKLFITCLIVLFSFGSSFGQEQEWQWLLKDSTRISESSEWSVDILQNLYISEAGVINKYDSTGTLKFTQSIKSLGELSDMVIINTMKLLYFSEEQQILCYLDNTLAQNQDCIDLMERNITYASHVARSDRSNKLWLYDEINYRLLLIDLESESTAPFVIENLRNITGSYSFLGMEESGGKLYINCGLEGIFVFDIYGSLLQKIDRSYIVSMSADPNGIYLLDNSGLLEYYLVDRDESSKISLPNRKVEQLKVAGSIVYLKSGDFVYKYSLEKSK